MKIKYITDCLFAGAVLLKVPLVVLRCPCW